MLDAIGIVRDIQNNSERRIFKMLHKYLMRNYFKTTERDFLNPYFNITLRKWDLLSEYLKRLSCNTSIFLFKIFIHFFDAVKRCFFCFSNWKYYFFWNSWTNDNWYIIFDDSCFFVRNLF